MRSVAPERARLMRARAQVLADGSRLSGVAEVIGRVFAIQAQDLDAAALGLRVRATGITALDVARAYEAERSLVRGWFMRGTLHAVPAGDVMWLTGLLGPVFLAAARRRHAELGLTDDLCQRSEQVVLDALRDDGPLTRAELTARLAGLGVPERGQQAFHLIRRAALRGVVCAGPVRNGESAYVALGGWVSAPDPGWAPQAAATELARRYLTGYAPATVTDFSTWSGLPVPLARQAWQALSGSGRYVEVEVTGQTCLLPEDRLAELDAVASPTDVRLVPAYDNYLVGYRTRALSVATHHEKQVWPGGGQIRPTVLADGLAVGTWSRRGGTARVDPFEPLDADVAAGVAAEEADIARFLDG